MSPSGNNDVPAIPSCDIILHRVQPSRLPSGAQDAALTAPVRDAQGYSQMREWRAYSRCFAQEGTFLLCPQGGHIYFAATVLRVRLTRRAAGSTIHLVLT